MIELRNVSISFDGEVILKDLYLKVEKGEKVAIIGPSGSGKSTLLRLLMGLFKPDSGQILIDGKDILQMNETQLLQTRMKFGMLFQSGALFDSMSIEENVAFPLIFVNICFMVILLSLNAFIFVSLGMSLLLFARQHCPY